MKNLIIIILLLVIVALIVFYIYRAKKKGQHCIGCPYAKQCGGKCNNDCNCESNKSDVNNK